MTTVVDSNVIVALWDQDDNLSAVAQAGLDAALDRGQLVIPAPVFSELMALPGRTETFLDRFFQGTGVAVDWDLDEQVWRAAGRAFQGYIGRRKKHPGPGPRRIPGRLLDRSLRRIAQLCIADLGRRALPCRVSRVKDHQAPIFIVREIAWRSSASQIVSSVAVNSPPASPIFTVPAGSNEENVSFLVSSRTIKKSLPQRSQGTQRTRCTSCVPCGLCGKISSFRRRGLAPQRTACTS